MYVVFGRGGTRGSGVPILDTNVFRSGSGVFERRATPGLDGTRVGAWLEGPAEGIEGTGGEGVFGL